MRASTLILLSFALLAMPVAAEVITVETETIVQPAPRTLEAPPRLTQTRGTQPVATLMRADYAAWEQVEAIGAWNRAGNTPIHDGFSRPLAVPTTLNLDPAEASRGVLIERQGDATLWSTHVFVENAHRLRLRLNAVELPANTVMWVYNDKDEVVRFGPELRSPDGELWTPSIGGERIYLDVQLPNDAAAYFELDAVAQMFRLDRNGDAIVGPTVAQRMECLEDAACYTGSDYTGLTTLKQAVSHVRFMNGGMSGTCTGQLIADTDTSTVIPYLTTANHCFATQSAASSVEAYFDDIAPSCMGTWPSISSLPRVNGATLLASTSSNDSTLIRLSANPPGTRSYLGWTTNNIPSGTQLLRVSHPLGYPQHVSTTQAITPASNQICGGVGVNEFAYSRLTFGGTFGGSSGSAITMLNGSNLYMVGQQLGACGTNTADGCDGVNNNEVDGRFSDFYPTVSSFLDPDTNSGGGCTPSDTVLCIDDEAGDQRFKATLFVGNGIDIDAQAVPLSSLGITRGGMFWFFELANPELLVKVLNGCGINGNSRGPPAPTTPPPPPSTIEDTQDSATEIYTNPANSLANTVSDLTAFSGCN
ncbi:MAG: hypothetical protein AAGD38_04690 [Acidobacteriota bacterium]